MQERRLTTKYRNELPADTTLEAVARCTKSLKIFSPFEATNKFRKSSGEVEC